MTLTVFIGTFDRLETLDRTVASYERLTTPHELVIVDNGTENRECREFLKTLAKEKRVKKVYNLPACVNMEEATDNFNVAIRDTFERGGKDTDWYAVSEADVCFDGTAPDALDYYLYLAIALPGLAVGPHLRVDQGIPAHYPLRSRVLACETWMLYRDEMECFDGIYYNKTQIDTTFHLFPRRRRFDRLRMDPVRVGPPYDAMHLDWYLDITAPNRENGIYIPGERKMGSWGKQWIAHFWAWFQTDPEMAFDSLLLEPTDPTDLCNNSFMLSWCYQYGHGVERDLELSRHWLEAAIPYPNDRYWSRQADWMAMVYDNDFSALGWDTVVA